MINNFLSQNFRVSMSFPTDQLVGKMRVSLRFPARYSWKLERSCFLSWRNLSETRVSMWFHTDIPIGNLKFPSDSTSGNPGYRNTEVSYVRKTCVKRAVSWDFPYVYLADLQISMWFLLCLYLETWVSAWFPLSFSLDTWGFHVFSMPGNNVETYWEPGVSKWISCCFITREISVYPLNAF